MFLFFRYNIVKLTWIKSVILLYLFYVIWQLPL